jgi:hypothetical protein
MAEVGTSPPGMASMNRSRRYPVTGWWVVKAIEFP